jgi:hypothetical protein
VAVREEMGRPAPADTVLLADELRRLQAPYRGLYEIALLMAWVAAVLSLSGMFAVAAHVLARRRKEVAVRMAVGASGRSILRVCLRDVAWAMPIGWAWRRRPPWPCARASFVKRGGCGSGHARCRDAADGWHPGVRRGLAGSASAPHELVGCSPERLNGFVFRSSWNQGP